MTCDTKANLDAFGTLCLAMVDSIGGMVKHIAPELRGNIPFLHGWTAAVHHGNQMDIIVMHDASGIPAIQSISDDYLRFLKTEIDKVNPLSFQTLYQKFGDRFYNIDIFLYAGPSFDNDAPGERFKKSLSNILTYLGPFVQDILIPKIFDVEKEKIAKLMPSARNYDLKSIAPALWILECEVSHRQGTASHYKDTAWLPASMCLAQRHRRSKQIIAARNTR